MGKKKGSGRKKNDDSLIVGIAIGYVAAVIVMNSAQPPIRIKVPSPALPNTTSTGGAQIRRLPARAVQVARVGEFFRRTPIGYGTLGVYRGR